MEFDEIGQIFCPYNDRTQEKLSLNRRWFIPQNFFFVQLSSPLKGADFKKHFSEFSQAKKHKKIIEIFFFIQTLIFLWNIDWFRREKKADKQHFKFYNEIYCLLSLKTLIRIVLTYPITSIETELSFRFVSTQVSLPPWQKGG